MAQVLRKDFWAFDSVTINKGFPYLKNGINFVDDDEIIDLTEVGTNSLINGKGYRELSDGPGLCKAACYGTLDSVFG